MKLQSRLMLILTGVSSLVLVTSLVAVFLLVQRDELRSFDRALLVEAHNTAHKISRQVVDQTIDGSIVLPESLQPTPRYVAVYGIDGAAQVSSRTFKGDAPRLEELEIDPDYEIPWEGISVDLVQEGVELRGVVVPIGEYGYLLLAASSKSLNDDTSFLLRLLPALFALGLVVTAVVSRLLGRLLARDVQSLARVVRSVTDGDLGARVGPLVGGAAETQALAIGLDEMIARLEELVRTQSRFTTDAAHELRSPLATLRGELQLALRRERSAEEYRASIVAVLEDVEALSALAEDLLALARLRARQPGSDTDTFAVVDAARDAIRMARGLTDARAIRLELRVDDAVAEVRVAGRRTEVARAIRNLIDNAIQHAPTGSEVLIELARDHERVLVAVVDHGPGVPEAERRSVFDPFFRGTRTRAGEPGGAGLGLAIAQAVATGVGGEIRLDATHLGGARFVLTMPIAPSLHAAMA
ncbi:MAG: ATP-binding protein [Nannocystaceae bacterium]